MTYGRMRIASWLLVAALTGVALIVALLLPSGTTLPIHWDIHGNVDSRVDKWAALLLPAACGAVLTILFQLLPRLEPNADGLARSRGLLLATWAGTMSIFPLIQLAVVADAFGWSLPVARLALAASGVALILIGNQLGKSRRMYLVGFRTPWTLASEAVWNSTHRLAGKLTVATGALIVLAALVPLRTGVAVPLVVAAVGISVIVPIVYSYLRWRREQV